LKVPTTPLDDAPSSDIDAADADADPDAFERAGFITEWRERWTSAPDGA
jgi:hypothetical protein